LVIIDENPVLVFPITGYMKKYIVFQFLIACFFNLQAQDTYIVSSVKGTITDRFGKKIVVGEKLKPSDKLVFSSKTSTLILAHPILGRLVITPNSNKVVNAKNNLFSVLLKDLLPPPSAPVVTAALATPPSPEKRQAQADTPSKPKPFIALNKGNSLAQNESLSIYEMMLSANGEYKLAFRDNGNLCLYKHDTVLVWCTQTSNKMAQRLVLEADGNLLLYDDRYQTIWETNTKGRPKKAGYKLALEDNGELILYNVHGQPVWKNGVDKL
jgi:hypothetical protein